MDQKELLKLLEQFKAGTLSQEDVLSALQTLPFENLGFARVDHHRKMRKGVPEAIFGMGKTPDQILRIMRSMADQKGNIIVTRSTQGVYEHVKGEFPRAEFHPASGAITLKQIPEYTGKGPVLVVSAGTADIPVAEEAMVTSDIFGNKTESLYDVGVAGLHRLLSELPLIRSARVIIVAAGMEGALPSVVAGLAAVPVIAVPTSMGYGTHFGGIAPLLAMLNSCAGLAVVNIDNGFGAGQLASLINHL